ncbi:MAG: hypothetical protein H6627_09235 [Calditrichae bacterium]|nr:hypothetical protein [Calditrichia bacterium]
MIYRLFITTLTILLFILSFSSVTAQTPGKSTFSAGIEGGVIDADALGSGMLLRSILRFNLQKKSGSSLLTISSRVAPEIMSLENRLSGLRLALQGDYFIHSANHSISGGLSGRRDAYSFNGHDYYFYELTGQAKYSLQLAADKALSLFDLLAWRRADALQENSIIQNRAELSYNFRIADWQFGTGAFYETAAFKTNLNDSLESAFNRRLGPQITLAYQRLFILNIDYKYGLHIQKYKADQQFSIMAGRYLTQRVSLFVFLYYLVKKQDDAANSITVFNRLSAANAFSAKLGVDVSKATHLYIKLNYEDQQIINNVMLISTWQGLLGMQHRF